MKVITNIKEMQYTADVFRLQGKRIGVVPTMGYLHEGHLSLVKIAKQHSDVVIMTLFVNPTQFAPNEDFNKYPRDFERDKKLAEGAGVDILFSPLQEQVYPANYLTYVETEKMTKVLEGKFRPTHFRGVTTIVAKLFNLTKPHIAVFGQKDAQQVAVIKQMVKDLNFDIEIIAVPIVREPDGLAMSSRNVYLSAEERKQALALSQSLKLAKDEIAKGERQSSRISEAMAKLITAQPFATIEYISIAHPERLEERETLTDGETVLISLAVRIGKTRLIDNVVVKV
jgi:pantoate--beta-alanine ligase